MNDQQFERLLALLGNIASSLEAIERALRPEAPNYKRPIEEFPTFDWTSIGARVLKVDQYGVAQVEHGDQVYTRRSPENKFGEAIWFSRPEGKDADGNVRYVRLITFRKFGDAEPISRKAEALVTTAQPKSVPQAAPETLQRPAGGAHDKNITATTLVASTGPQDDFDGLPSEGERRHQAAQAVLDKLQRMAAGYTELIGKPITPELQQKAYNNLRTLCGTDDLRRAVLKALFDKEHMAELTMAEAQAIRDWVRVSKVGDDWVPSQIALDDLKALREGGLI